MINAQFRTFGEAAKALEKLVDAFAKKVHPHYVKNAWMLWDGCCINIPTEEQIANTVSYLLGNIKKQSRSNHTYSCTGRITVEVIRRGKRHYMPRMFIDTLSTDDMLLY